jgi:Response regulator containing a CheY-like receiver domain and an HD-GYP domain
MSNEKQVILVVDDTATNLAIVSDLLKETYKVKIATNGERALAVAADRHPDLILLDIMMPVMDGYETCRCLKADPLLRDIPVIFLTAKNSVEDEETGFALGAVDYILKPVSPPLLLARIKTHLLLKQARDSLQNQNFYLEAEVTRRVKEITVLQEVAIAAMASLAETRDNETGGHIRRTQYYLNELAQYLRQQVGGEKQLSPENIDLMVKSAPLHDIGKVGIPDHILLKPGPLTTDEFSVMKTHTTLGRDALSRAEFMQGQPETFLHLAKEIAYSHHEKWNGGGYPEGLAGEAIPISGRLMAVADVYDALISKRVYKDPVPHETAVEIIRKEAGAHFDPRIVAAFMCVEKHFLDIRQKFPD